MRYLRGIDFGGGASKATLLSEEGVITAEHTVEYPTLHPTVGACEQNPGDWIAALTECTGAILKKSNIKPESIAAIAVDSATHTSLVCDGEFRPLRPAMHWTDSRSRREAEVMNPCDHPHGGGEGKSPVGRPSPVTPWGKPALGYKTRNKKARTDKFIVKRRNAK